MELKEFITEAITQICEGVKNAQDKCYEMGALVNPMLAVKVCNDETYSHDDQDYPVTKINFRVGLAESSAQGQKNGIGVFLSKISLGHENNKENSSESVTSIDFSVTAVLPYVSRQGKHVPLSSLGLY